MDLKSAQTQLARQKISTRELSVQLAYLGLGIERPTLIQDIAARAARFASEGGIVHGHLLLGVAPSIPLMHDAGFGQKLDSFVVATHDRHERKAVLATVNAAANEGLVTLRALSDLGILGSSFGNFSPSRGVDAFRIATNAMTKNVADLDGVDIAAISRVSDPRHTERRISQAVAIASMLEQTGNFAELNSGKYAALASATPKAQSPILSQVAERFSQDAEFRSRLTKLVKGSATKDHGPTGSD